MRNSIVLLLVQLCLIGCSQTIAKRTSAATFISNTHGRVAPDFQARDVNGGLFRLSDLRGKVVLLTFWASWCPTCKVEIPMLADLKQTIASKDFEVLALQLDKRGEIPEQFNQLKKQLIFAKDSFSQATNRFQVSVLPASYLLDREGRFVFFRDPKSQTLNISVSGAREWGEPETLKGIRNLIK